MLNTCNLFVILSESEESYARDIHVGRCGRDGPKE